MGVRSVGEGWVRGAEMGAEKGAERGAGAGVRATGVGGRRA